MVTILVVVHVTSSRALVQSLLVLLIFYVIITTTLLWNLDACKIQFCSVSLSTWVALAQCQVNWADLSGPLLSPFPANLAGEGVMLMLISTDQNMWGGGGGKTSDLDTPWYFSYPIHGFSHWQIYPVTVQIWISLGIQSNTPSCHFQLKKYVLESSHLENFCYNSICNHGNDYYSSHTVSYIGCTGWEYNFSVILPFGLGGSLCILGTAYSINCNILHEL